MTTRTLPLLADRFTVNERPTIPVGPPRARRKPLPDANPIAAHVLGQLTTRFRAAAERALAAEGQRGQAVAYLESMRRWMHVGGPCPAAFRAALEGVNATPTSNEASR